MIARRADLAPLIAAFRAASIEMDAVVEGPRVSIYQLSRSAPGFTAVLCMRAERTPSGLRIDCVVEGDHTAWIIGPDGGAIGVMDDDGEHITDLAAWIAARVFPDAAAHVLLYQTRSHGTRWGVAGQASE